jgi:putative flavoprotein involved in K+ transport
MPYLPFPETWPVHPTKEQFADWLDAYPALMGLDVWNATECHCADFDAARDEWNVEITRNGRKQTLRPKQLILANGLAGPANLPRIPGMDKFRGEQFHASTYRDARPYRNHRCVVIGAGTSAHDICAALWQAGANVTMVQRSPTMVVRVAAIRQALADLYSEEATANGITAEKADLLFASMPHRLVAALQVSVFANIRERDAVFYERLEKAGFLLNYGEDESGLVPLLFRRAAGHYIDVGASELIANGSIKLRSGVGVSAVKEHGVVLSDGSELPADLIVYATGYQPHNARAAQVLPPEMTRKVGRIYGLGSDTKGDPGPWEGEVRNLWKPTQQRSLWFHGGGIGTSRPYSRYLALQIKARQVGIATPVHALAPVHHTE